MKMKIFYILRLMHMLKRMKSKSFEDLYEIYLDNFDKYKDEIKYEDSDYPHIKMTWNEENLRQ